MLRVSQEPNALVTFRKSNARNARNPAALVRVVENRRNGRDVSIDGGGLQRSLAMLVAGLLRRAQAYQLLEDRTCNRCERLTLEVLAEPTQVILAIWSWS